MKRGNRIKSRLLSAFLVLVMLVTMVPSWAFADPVTKPQEKQMQSEATSLEGKEEDFFAEEKEGNVRETVTAEPMAVTTSFNWGMTLQALAKEEGWGFLLQAVSQNRQDTGTRYTKQLKTSVTLTLPGGLNFPEGTYTYENGVIRAGETPVVSLDSLPVTVTVTDFARRSGQELSFTLAQVRPEGDDLSAELEDIKTRILIQEEAFSTEEDSGLSAEGAVTMKASLEAVPVSGDDTIKQEQEAQAQLPDSLYEGESLSKSPVPDGDGEPTPTAEPTPSAEPTPTAEPTPAPSAEPTPTPEAEANRIEISQYREGWEKTIYWVDNNNEAGKRTDVSGAPSLVKLSFSIGEKEYQELAEETMAQLGLTSLPAVQVSSDATHYYLSLGADTLPSQIRTVNAFGETVSTDTVEWKMEPAGVEGYEFFDITPETIKDFPLIVNTENYGWYHVLQTDFVLTVEMRDGDLNSSETEFTNALNEQLHFTGDAASDPFDLPFGDIKWEQVSVEDEVATLRYTVRKYNLDGSRITYTVGEIDGDGRLEGVFTEGDDYYAISYDNTNAPNFGGITTEAHSGGKVILTLTGKTDFTAVKEWLDPAGSERPEGTFELWRYRKGQSFTTAAPVRDDTGLILTAKLDPSQNTQEISFTDLEKYDPDGYQYIYVIREYLEGEHAGHYDQVFGKVEADGSIIDTVAGDGTREERNTYVYDGGTLSNRRNDTVTVSVRKDWKAAAFQADFQDVAVTMQLQSRVKGTEDPWTDTDTVISMSEFYSEHLYDTAQATVPKYDVQGQELEYRWVETGVYQGIEDNRDPGDQDQNLMEGSTDGSYEMTHEVTAADGQTVTRTITYRAESENTANGENGVYATAVTNRLANQIDYTIEKLWYGADGKPLAEKDIPEAELTFSLYRSTEGSPLSQEPVGQVEMDGKVDEKAAELTLAGGEKVTVRESEPWILTVTALNEFDEEGRRYEYAVLETKGVANYTPVYETSRDPQTGDYHTNVINAPGTGYWIMVSKEWIDDSDTMHREPVTVQVYDKKTDQPLENAAAVLSDSNSWNQLIFIGNMDPDNVYILETEMGDRDIPAPEDVTLKEDGAVSGEHTFQAQYHRYEATYRTERTGDNQIPNHIVTNRRLGNIDLTATKHWIDQAQAREQIQSALTALGEGAPALYLQLEFAQGTQAPGGDDAITRNQFSTDEEKTYDTVTIANEKVPIQDETGKHVYSQQKVSFEETDKDYAFYNLPKYLTDGASVEYTIREVWLDPSGKELSRQDLKKNYPDLYEAWAPFVSSIVQTEYVSYDNREDKNDVQTITVTNRLSQTKDIRWHKQWQDAYTYQNGQRPDIFLDIYQVTHNKDGKAKTPVLYQKDYRWTYNEDDEDLDEMLSREKHWHALLEDVPKYDEYGYEIFYYAVEKTHVNSENYDYTDVEYGVPSGNPANPDKIGTAQGALDAGAESEYKENTVQISPKEYALKEEGTFINRLESDITIVGQKLWSSLPAGYPDEDLPAVTFTLYQKLRGAEDEGREVATLTVKDWSHARQDNGTYEFAIKYTGDNTGITADSQLPDGQTPLPKYDENGNIFEYTLKETKIHVQEGDDSAENWEDIYKQPEIHTYVVENVYQPKELGSLKVVKYLQAEDPDHLPAVTLKLMRTYTGSDGKPSAAEEVDRCVLTFTGSDEGGYRMASHEFTDLPYYAPNGSAYQYYVAEDKTNLGGFDTWVVQESLELAKIETTTSEAPAAEQDDLVTSGSVTLKPNPAEGEEEEPQEPEGGENPPAENPDEGVVTFINKPQETAEMVTVAGAKIWKDYENLFETRPNNITLELYRQADAQPGQSNGIPSQRVEKNLYEITWDEESQKTSQWAYTITGKAESGELAKYAPNGMPWKYSVKEVREDPWKDYYTTGTVPPSAQASEDGTIHLNDLANSMQTGVSITKDWVDSEGNPINEDYLGYDLSVTFALQVREANGTWQDAGTYLQTALGEDYSTVIEGNYVFKKTIIGRIDDEWPAASFANLPRVIKKDNDQQLIKLQYRIVETQISYGETSVTIDVTPSTGEQYTYTFEPNDMFAPAYPNRGAGEDLPPAAGNGFYQPSDQTVYNMLNTTDLSVTKKWVGDYHNIYGSRPGTVTNWETSFLIQREKANGTWEDVQVYGDGEAVRPLIVKISGANSEDTKTITISSLPDGTYRAVELQPGYKAANPDEFIVSPDSGEDKTYYGTYEAAYDNLTENHTTVTNTLTSLTYSLTKNWVNNVSSGASVSVKLQYRNADGDLVDFSPAAVVVLDGTADTVQNGPYFEDEAWHAIWRGVPKVMPGSQTDKNGETIYEIVEVDSDAYIQQDSGVTAADGEEHAYEVTNMAAVSLEVEKVWHGTQASSVTVGLYRYVTDDGEGTAVPVTDDEKPVTAELNGANGWKYTFAKLPKYDGDGKTYTYLAKELQVDGENLTDGEVTYTIDGKTYKAKLEKEEHEKISETKFSSVITNRVYTDLSGTKTWVDDGNKEGTRPEAITLILKGQSAGSVFEDTVNQEPEWVKNGNTWTYTYSMLPQTDENGKLYTYWVEEAPLSDTDYQVSYAEDPDGPYDTDTQGLYIRNELKKPIDITVIKEWLDEETGLTRPTQITLTLLANGQPAVDEDGQPVAAVTLPRETGILEQIGDFFTGADSQWQHTFENLPKYDDAGKLIDYTVTETGVTEDYENTVTKEETDEGYTFTVVNTALVDIPVEKRWINVSANRQEEVTVGLYRKTKDGALEPVLDRDSKEPLTVVLNESNQWKSLFEKLPVYDADSGSRYEYSIQELTVGGEPAEESGYRISYDTAEDGTLVVTNRYRPHTTPTPEPSGEPTEEPTPTPSGEPTEEPTPTPSGEPTEEPTPTPSGEPTEEPTPTPSGEPTEEPTPDPSGEPTKEPTDVPETPGKRPSATPTDQSSVTKRPARPSSSQTSDTSSETKKKKDVKTGDETSAMPLVMLLFSAAAGGVLLRKKLEKTEDRDDR